MTQGSGVTTAWGWAARYAVPAMLASCLPSTSLAFMEDTRLLDLRAGTALSDSVRSLQNDGYELSDGTPLIFGDWYRPDWPDVHIKFLTKVNRNLGLIWGLSTGEQGGQYEIQPSLHLGIITERELSPTESLSFSITGVVGGKLGEKPCVAGYGALGGTQSVNCRLAATTMRPVDTLQYLFNESPSDQIRVNLRYQINF